MTDPTLPICDVCHCVIDDDGLCECGFEETFEEPEPREDDLLREVP